MESSQKEEGSSSEETKKKCCSDCKTTKTPLWRSGPSGPKSLCNACGIRYRKKRPSSSGGGGGGGEGKKGKSRNLKLRETFKVSLMRPLGKEVEVMVMEEEQQRSPSQWGEVERAALLLMALSCGAVFA